MNKASQRAFAIALFLAGTSTVLGDWWLNTTSDYQRMGGAARIGPYPTREAADQINATKFGSQGTVTGSNSPGGAGGGVQLTPAQNMMVQGAGQVGAAVGNAIGQAMSQALFGNPQAAAAEAHNLNQQGVQYYNQENWQAAAQCFQAAIGKAPNDPVIEQNLINANTQLRAQLEQIERARQEAVARQKQESYDRISSQLRLSDGPNDKAGSGQQLAVNVGGGAGLSLQDVRLGDDNGGGGVGIRGLPGIYLGQAQVAVPELQPIPANLSQQAHYSLAVRAAQLQSERSQLDSWSAAFKQKYGAGVMENSPEATAAANEQAALQKALNAHNATVEQFNRDVKLAASGGN